MNYNRIGKDGYDVPTYNSEEEKELKIYEDVEAWWRDLDDNYKMELMESYYPDRAHLMNVDTMWNGIDQSEKVSLWEEELPGFHGVKV